jgi:transposase
MVRYRTSTVEFKRQVAEEHPGGGSLNELARRRDISRELLRTWVKKAAPHLGEEGCSAPG